MNAAIESAGLGKRYRRKWALTDCTLSMILDEPVATHHLLTGPLRDPSTLPDSVQVISASHTDVQSTLLVRTAGQILDPAWTVSEVGLEDLVLAYMSQAAGPRRRDRNGHRHLEVQK